VNVTLINYTPDALETLIFTKNTRLRMSATGLDEIREWPEEKKAKELEYMKNTIQSSWEFVDYVFLISDVTRAFTHQLVRHRVGCRHDRVYIRDRRQH
jgi:thymidylate synthase ThyX